MTGRSGTSTLGIAVSGEFTVVPTSVPWPLGDLKPDGGVLLHSLGASHSVARSHFMRGQGTWPSRAGE